LFYRLNVIELLLPPLRERRADIVPLAEHLLRFFARQAGKSISGFAESARDALPRYPWPGNIRELRNAVERGVILASSALVELSHFPSQIGNPIQTIPGAGEPRTLDQLEAEHIGRTLASTATMEEAADRLGIDPSTLYRKRKKYGI
jgi:two-component system, NtrC family, response regulator AlgB